jgi:DNA-binding response OmpR family regulator
MTPIPLIYVVEDDESSRDLLVRRLRKRHYRAEPVESGESCLERLAQQLPDLILLDLVMPAMGGLEVLAEIRKTHSLYQLPVIVVTGKVAAEDVVDGLHLGANDYVTKPITFPVLEARIKTQIAVKQSVENLLQAERQRVMIESLGAACHHLSQPMTSVMGNLGLLQESLGPDDAAT